MELTKVFGLLIFSLILIENVTSAPQEQPAFELPVQLVGFPVIIAAVRITNFLKKLAYSLDPKTYVSRSKRSAIGDKNEMLDITQVEKKLVAEFGQNVCIYERLCEKYAEMTLKYGPQNQHLNWNEIFRQYKASPNPMKENYLLSVFLGEIVARPKLCHQLAKKGRSCNDKSHYNLRF